MKIEIKRDSNNLPIGWSITADSDNNKEINDVNQIRNLQFFGFNDTAIQYNGRTNGTDVNAGTLHWIQKKHQK
jgi:hypothetical protein